MQKPIDSLEGSKVEQKPDGNIRIGDSVRSSILTIDGTLEHPWGLTPKANQASLMEKLGIRVPKRFRTLEEGIDWLESQGAGNGAGIYLRSEHPDDGKLNARSGILTSLRIGYVGQLDKENAPAFWSSNIGLCETKVEILDALKCWMDEEIQRSNNFGYDASKTSFTFWEEIPGDNYTVVRDKNVPGMYFIHPIQSAYGDAGGYRVHIDDVYDNRVERALIDFYNQVLATQRFGESPIMEIQLKRKEGETYDQTGIEYEPYFLQGLVTSPGDQSDWKLDRDMEDGEFEALFVRGVTPPDGIVVCMHVMPFGNYRTNYNQIDPLNNYSGTVVDAWGESSQNATGKFSPMIERLVQERADKIFILGLNIDSDAEYMIAQQGPLSLAIHHTNISMIHKPRISLVVDRRYFYLNDRENVRLRIVSDGTKAYIRILD